MTTSTQSGAHARLLLTTATGLGTPRRIDALARALRPAFALAPEPGVAGLAVYDEERGLLGCHVLRAGREELETELVSAVEGAALLGDGGEVELKSSGPFLRALAPRVFVAPLRIGGRSLGALFVGEREGGPISGLREYLESLARIVEPHVWNCFVDERFARGDRRRDALVELSRVINTSLEPRVVLHLARTAIGAIEGHRSSWIGLVDEGGASWRLHDRPQDYAGDAREPEPRAVAGTVMEHLLRADRTYESDDLESKRVFEGDDELLARGVRRYVATPLRAGGKVLGGFLFGTDEPHPALRVDVWLIENIALQLALALDNARQNAELMRLSARREQQNIYLREELEREHVAGGMIGRSPALRAVLDQVARVAPTNSTVLISGPTGVGKELVAHAIHEASRVRDQPLVKLNCAAIPEGMVESELFGHERGAFTSAVERRIGRFELARQGTLFLDEVGELPLAVQAKLLRVLQEGEFERVGGSKTMTSDARIVAATNRDLAKAVESGAFRADLFYRLNVFPIAVPALDERREDIPLLVDAFVAQLARRTAKRFTSIDPAALEHLCRRAWPGNVRELRHVLERAMILSDEPVLRVEAEERGGLEPASQADVPGTLEEVEAAHIRAALEHTGGVIEGPRGAARLLGLKGSTLRFRMKRLGIRRGY